MVRSRSLFVVVLLLRFCVCVHAYAQDEPEASQWGPRHEGLPGQPAHGFAFEHMPGFQAGAIDNTLPGQPAHGLALQPLTDAQEKNMQAGSPPVGVQPVPSVAPPLPVEDMQISPAPEVTSAPPQSMASPPVGASMAYQPPLYQSPSIPPAPMVTAMGSPTVPPTIYQAPPPVSSDASVAPSALLDTTPQAAAPGPFNRDASTAPPMNTNPRLDFEQPPPGPPTHMSLATRPGIDIGGQYYFDRYEEPDDPTVVEGGEMGAAMAAATFTYHRWFTTLDARAGFGSVDYQGSGKLNGTTNDLWEGRWVVGWDYIPPEDERYPDFSVSPYFGIGYRYLFNDLRGVSSTGAHGYRRENQIYYLPIGVKPRFPLDMDSRITSTLEFDPILFGQQTTYYSDLGLGDPDIRNRQPFGIGVRADAMYETKWWSVGPFVNFWAMDKSQDKIFSSPGMLCGGTPCVGWEPQNFTFEVGIQAKLHFLDSLFKLD